MSQTTAIDRISQRHRDQPHDGVEDPVRAFANGILLALPLWGLIGLIVWAII